MVFDAVCGHHALLPSWETRSLLTWFSLWNWRIKLMHVSVQKTTDFEPAMWTHLLRSVQCLIYLCFAVILPSFPWKRRSNWAKKKCFTIDAQKCILTVSNQQPSTRPTATRPLLTALSRKHLTNVGKWTNTYFTITTFLSRCDGEPFYLEKVLEKGPLKSTKLLSGWLFTQSSGRERDLAYRDTAMMYQLAGAFFVISLKLIFLSLLWAGSYLQASYSR